MLLEAIVWGLFGLIIGSFVNVLILREGLASLRGRSACPACARQLEWYELVPIVSWLILLGRCRTCRASISLQYPLVELLCGLGFAALGIAHVPLFAAGIGACIFALLVAITVYDLYHQLIPDAWSYAFSALAFLMGAFTVSHDTSTILLFLLAGPAVAFPLFSLWFFSRGAWMGFGDVKLALGIGWLLGISGGLVALCLAFVLGAIVGVCVLLPLPHIVRILQRAGITRLREHAQGFTMKSEVPFGPFLVLGTCIVWFSHLFKYPLIERINALLLFWS